MRPRPGRFRHRRSRRERGSARACSTARARARRPRRELPGVSGYEICRRLRDEFGSTLPILFLSGERTESFDKVAGLLVGGDDYLVKPFSPDELVARVQKLAGRAQGQPEPAAARLTKREREVLSLLAEGKSQAQIARTLVISPKTVGTHIEHILSKLGVRSRAQAVAYAYREGLVKTAV